MTYEAVDVYVVDQDKEPIEGVVCRLFSQDGTRVHGQYTTDNKGRIALLLPAPSVWQLRMYKFGVQFDPTLLEVVEEKTHAFTCYGQTFSWPSSTDPRLCVASGFFRDVTGAPKANQDLHFIADFDPFVLDGTAVVNERRSVRTDARGWVEVSLVRNAIYAVTMEGWQDQLRRITVPDAQAVNLAHLLFPRVARVERPGVGAPETGPVIVRKGKLVEVPLCVWTTDLRLLDRIGSDLVWLSSAPSVFTIETLSTSAMVLRGQGRGTAELQAKRSPYAQGGAPPVYYPDEPIKGVPIPVTVV